MPFASDTLPEAVENLPKAARSIWLSIFESTYRTFSGNDAEKEEASKIAAWAAVRSKFMRGDAGEWNEKEMISFDDLHHGSMHGHWTRSIKFSPNMLEGKKRIAYGEVYRPWEVDAQGDFADEMTIENAAHNFLKRHRKIGEQHTDWSGKGIPVESWIARENDSAFPIPGTWVLGTQWSEEMWSKILNGEKTGYSLGGEWTRIPVVAGAEFAKRVAAGKSAEGSPLFELDSDLFERPTRSGPRIISQIVGLEVEEVSGVDMPANRQPFKLFKSSRDAPSSPRVFVIGKGIKEEEEQKQTSGNPYIDLYEQFIEFGLSRADAIAEVEAVLGPAPAGTWDRVKSKDEVDDCVAEKMGDPAFREEFPEQDQRLAVARSMCEEKGKEMSKDAGAPAIEKKDEQTEAPISGLRRMEDMIKAIMQKLGGAEEESETEDEAMLPEERKELDDLKKGFADLNGTLGEIKSLLAETKAAGSCSCQEKETPKIGEEQKDLEGEEAEGAYASDAELVEVAAELLELKKELAALKSRPGISAIPGAIAVREGKSAAGAGEEMVFSSLVGTYIPKSAREAETKMAKADIERRRGKRAQDPRMQIRMGK